MRKLILFKTTTIILFLFVACNKKEINIQNINKSHEIQDKVESIDQKMYNVSPEQINASINLLNSINNSNNAKNFMPESDLAPDSSIWVLEAALNYHFDKAPDDHDVLLDTCEFSTQITSVPLPDGTMSYIVNASDFINIYHQFISAITQKATGPKKVKVIDITATIDFANNSINYKADIVFYIGSSIPNCVPFPTGSSVKFSSYFYSMFACGNSTAPDGPTEVTKRLNNCQGFEPLCGQSYYWVNVSKRIFYKAACFGPTTPPQHFLPYQATNLCNSGLLYNWYNNTSGSACSIYPGNYVNSQVAALTSVAVSNIPITPVGLTVANQFCAAWHETFVNNSSEWGWCNAVDFGYPVCKPIDPN